MSAGASGMPGEYSDGHGKLRGVVSRLLAQVFVPLNAVFALTALSFVLAWKGRSRQAIAASVAAFATLWVSATPRVAGALMRPLERQVLPVPAERAETADAIVVLGGALAAKEPPRTRVELTEASDRILHAMRLFRARRAPLLVASGGGRDVPESEEIAELLVELGVPASAILKESRSTSTRENALETSRLLAGRGVKRILLVTSALHMLRARRAFTRAGFEVVPAPTDFQVIDQEEELGGLSGWLPNAGGLVCTTTAAHEYLGLLYYRLRGWI